MKRLIVVVIAVFMFHSSVHAQQRPSDEEINTRVQAAIESYQQDTRTLQAQKAALASDLMMARTELEKVKKELQDYKKKEEEAKPKEKEKK